VLGAVNANNFNVLNTRESFTSRFRLQVVIEFWNKGHQVFTRSIPTQQLVFRSSV
jgi:hypothetical protein